MPTMADVANKAGVALSTVSHALSGKRPVSSEIKARIFQAMADLDYQPSPLARGLATRRSGILALLLSPAFHGLIEAQFLFVASIANTVRQLGYNLLLWTAPPENLEFLWMIQQGFVEGVIMMEVTLHDLRVDQLIEKGYPFSIIGRRQGHDVIDLVDFDFEYAMDICVGHLAELGHHHIGLIGASSAAVAEEYGPAIRTIRGFNHAVASRGLEGTIEQCSPNPQVAYNTTRALLKEHPSLSAIINVSENTLDGIVQAIREQGLRIPEDFSVVAVTSARYTQLATLAVTGIDIPFAEMGQIGAEMLIQQLNGDQHQPRQVVLCPPLTVRASTGAYTAKRQ